MPIQRLRVVLISGCMRSGTTVLDNILGQSPGFFSGGELVDFWRVAQAADRICACGARLSQCGVWSRVLRRLDGDPRLSVSAGGDLSKHYQYMRLRHLWRLATEEGRRRFLQLASERARDASDLYHAISEKNRVHTIIDSSKSVERTYLLTHTPGLDVYVVHLVRDARAVAFSCRRKKPDPSTPNSFMRTYHPVASALRWVLSQQVERLCNIPDRYLLVRYEDFMAAPDRELERIFRMIGEPVAQRPQVKNNTVWLDRVHSINGNANRFRQGPVRLQVDDEWRSEMSGSDHAVVSALTWPMLRHYRYELNVRRSVQAAAEAMN